MDHRQPSDGETRQCAIREDQKKEKKGKIKSARLDT
jgi:hypothetical protein